MKTHLIPRFLAASALAIGFGLAWAALAFWVGATVLDAWPGRGAAHVENLVVAADGTPLIQDYSLDNLSNVTYRGLDGGAHAIIDRKGMAEPMYLNGEREPAGFWTTSGWWGRIWSFVNEREPAAVWYLVSDGGSPASGWFVGYERVSNRRIGYIGLAGFREQPVPPDERFPLQVIAGRAVAYNSLPMSINMNNSWTPPRPDPRDVPPRLVHIPFGNLLRVVDLSERTTTTVFEAPGPIASVGVPMLSTYFGYDPSKEPLILVRVGEKVYKLDRAYKLVGVATLPAEIGIGDAVTWYEVGDGRVIVEAVLPTADDEAFPRSSRPTRVYRIAADGTVRDSIDLALRNGAGPQHERAQFTLMGLGLPSPTAFLATEAIMALQGRTAGFASRFADVLRRSWPFLAGVVALALVLAAIAWRRADAFGLSRRERVVWAVFTALFGVPAFVGLLLHRTWPAREPCPHCHASCPRDRDGCAACGTPFPAPALKGTEIFA